jgi:DNA polymerase I-like protein with 3'-5' exonuclease and polymerase domains
LAYGGGFRTLAENLLIQENLAKDIYYSTLDLYSGLKPWQQQVSDFARRTGYSMTAYGNRRHMTKDLWSSDDGLVKRMERQAFNSVIQSTAADILKVTKQAIHDRDMVNRYSLRAIKPIYDEITASVPIDLATAYALEMKEVMSITPPGYPVALEVDIEIGRTWGDQIEVLEQTQDGIDAVINQIRNQS